MNQLKGVKCYNADRETVGKIPIIESLTANGEFSFLGSIFSDPSQAFAKLFQ
jgi:hypothetical protein